MHAQERRHQGTPAAAFSDASQSASRLLLAAPYWSKSYFSSCSLRRLLLAAQDLCTNPGPPTGLPAPCIAESESGEGGSESMEESEESGDELLGSSEDEEGESSLGDEEVGGPASKSSSAAGCRRQSQMLGWAGLVGAVVYTPCCRLEGRACGDGAESALPAGCCLPFIGA